MKTLAVTRPTGLGGDTTRLIQGLGWTSLIFHTVELKPRPATGILSELRDPTFPNLPDWYVFMSPRGVELFFQTLKSNKGATANFLRHSQILAVGPKTKLSLSQEGLRDVHTPDHYSSEGIFEFLTKLALQAKRIILVRSQQANDILARRLREVGAYVTTIPLYESAIPKDYDSVWRFLTQLRSGTVDATLFTSALSAVNLFEISHSRSPPEDPGKLLGSTLVGAIGPTTAAQLTKLGVTPGFMPESYTIEHAVTGLVNAMERGAPPTGLI